MSNELHYKMLVSDRTGNQLPLLTNSINVKLLMHSVFRVSSCPTCVPCDQRTCSAQNLTPLACHTLPDLHTANMLYPTGNNTECCSAVSGPPFPLIKNKEALYKVRGDLYAGAMKLHEETLSITAELELLVDEKDGEEIWNLTEGDSVEVGPFRVRAGACACIERTVMVVTQPGSLP